MIADDDNTDEEEVKEEDAEEEVADDSCEGSSENEYEHDDEDENKDNNGDCVDVDDDVDDGENYEANPNGWDRRPWNEKRTRKLCARLQKDDPSLTFMRTSYFDDFDYAAQLAVAMIGNTQLRDFVLTDVELNEQDATHLANGIAQSNLKRIFISGHLTESTKEILYQNISTSTTVQEIHLRGVESKVPNGLGKVVLALKQLELLSIDESILFANPDHIQLIHDSFMSTIKCFKLCGADLGDFTMAAQMFSHNTTLKTLELYSCEIDDRKIRLMVENWHPNSQLEHLLLQENGIGPEGAQLLFRAAPAHPSLQEIDLSFNHNIDFKGLKLVGEELAAQLHLKVVDLTGCAVSAYDHSNYFTFEDDDELELKQEAGAIKEARYALMNGMKQNRSISQIHVDIECDSLQVRFYAKINQFGRQILLITGHELASSTWCHVLAKCQQHPGFGTSFLYYFLCEQPALAESTRNLRRGNEE